MSAFWKKYEKEMKEFGLLSKYEESYKHLQSHPHLVCEHMASYLAIWCIDLCVEEACRTAEHHAVPECRRRRRR